MLSFKGNQDYDTRNQQLTNQAENTEADRTAGFAQKCDFAPLEATESQQTVELKTDI